MNTTERIKAEDILQQIGWYDQETCFIHFNLTPAQLDLLFCASAKLGKFDGELIEELCMRVVE